MSSKAGGGSSFAPSQLGGIIPNMSAERNSTVTLVLEVVPVLSIWLAIIPMVCVASHHCAEPNLNIGVGTAACRKRLRGNQGEKREGRCLRYISVFFFGNMRSRALRANGTILPQLLNRNRRIRWRTSTNRRLRCPASAFAIPDSLLTTQMDASDTGNKRRFLPEAAANICVLPLRNLVKVYRQQEGGPEYPGLYIGAYPEGHPP